MSDKMDFVDREVMVAATLAAGCCDVDTTEQQAVEKFHEVLFQLATKGGIAAIRKRAREMATERDAHQTLPRKAR